MTYPQILRRIIIPEALENAMPGIANSLIGLVKGTSLASTCGIIEITYQNSLLAGRDYRYLEGYVALAIIYWIITIVLEQVFKIIERKIRIPEQPKPIDGEGDDNNKDKGFKAFFKNLFKKDKKESSIKVDTQY